jgi:hypothetical protein
VSVLTLCERTLGLLDASDLRDLESDIVTLLENLNHKGLLAAYAPREAVACARHFASVRDGLFMTYPWVFARRNSALSLTGGNMPGWRFVYSLPSECVKLHAIVLPHGTSPAYEQAGTVVGCNARNVGARYSVVVEDTDDWPMLFQDAFCGRLAHEISLAVKGVPELGAQAFQLFQFAISEGYRTGAIDPGARLDNRFSNATWNTPKLFSPSPAAAAPAAAGPETRREE